MYEEIKGLVSVIIPCYNCEKTIAETINSVLSQTYSNWEVLCCDDGSEDDTCSVIENFAERDSRIRLLKRESENKGGSVCRNIGLHNSQGEYVIFLDGDDLLISTCIEKRVQFIKNSNYNFCVFPFAYYNNSRIGSVGVDKSISNPLYAFAVGHAVWQTTCPIYRRSFVLSINGFNESYQRLQDVEFGLRAIFYSNGNYCINFKGTETDCLYRTSSNSNKEKKYRAVLSHYDKLCTLVQKLEKKGAFSNKIKRKVMYICLTLTAGHLFILNGSNCVDIDNIFPNSNMNKLFGLEGKIIIGIVNCFSLYSRFQIFLIRLFRRTLMKIFF